MAHLISHSSSSSSSGSSSNEDNSNQGLEWTFTSKKAGRGDPIVLEQIDDIKATAADSIGSGAIVTARLITATARKAIEGAAGPSSFASSIDIDDPEAVIAQASKEIAESAKNAKANKNQKAIHQASSSSSSSS